MTAPGPHRFVVQQVYDPREIERAEGLGRWLEETTARALADLDAQVADALRTAPPGARICVHSPEAINEGPGLMADDYVIYWRQQLHELAEGEPCPKGTGGRVEYRIPGSGTQVIS